MAFNTKLCMCLQTGKKTRDESLGGGGWRDREKEDLEEGRRCEGMNGMGI